MQKVGSNKHDSIRRWLCKRLDKVRLPTRVDNRDPLANVTPPRRRRGFSDQFWTLTG